MHASHALGNLATLADGQNHIYQAGGIEHLLALLGVGKAQEYAARALARAAHENLAVQQQVFKLGGVAGLLRGSWALTEGPVPEVIAVA